MVNPSCAIIAFRPSPMCPDRGFFADTYDRSARSAPSPRANAPSTRSRRRSQRVAGATGIRFAICRSRPIASTTRSRRSSERPGCQLSSAITIVTQTRVRPRVAENFGNGKTVSAAIAELPGFFIRPCCRRSRRPSRLGHPAALRRYRGLGLVAVRATARLLAGVRPMLIGPDDVHLVRDGELRAHRRRCRR